MVPRTYDDGARAVLCARGHRFDAARQGYFNLLTGRGTAFQPDTAAMVQARMDFLARGHYRALAEAVRDAVTQHSVDQPVILDAGAGTGYYLRAVLEQVPAAHAIALDLSKFALRRTARLLPAATCLVWDIWRTLPIRDGAVDVILNVFAPRNSVEFHRVLTDEGVLVVVTPLPHHLGEMAAAASLLKVPAGKIDDVASGLGDAFERLESRAVEVPMMLSGTDIADAAAMGPAGHHQARLDPRDLEAELKVTAAFSVQTFRRRKP